LWPTVEHAFQAAKCCNDADKEMIRKARTPGEAKRLGRRTKLRTDWEDVKVDIMRECLLRKFLCNDTLLQQLLNTGTEVLIEGTTWHDNFWGKCTCSKCVNIMGKNMLGRLLMEIRDNYRAGNYIWAVRTTDNEYHSSIKGYFKERKDAEIWLSKNYDMNCNKPCIPDDFHLLILKVK
jgi:ribA/ribD-fused uncharacterized protein